jgi:hypothetical protein
MTTEPQPAALRQYLITDAGTPPTAHVVSSADLAATLCSAHHAGESLIDMATGLYFITDDGVPKQVKLEVTTGPYDEDDYSEATVNVLIPDRDSRDPYRVTQVDTLTYRVDGRA